MNKAVYGVIGGVAILAVGAFAAGTVGAQEHGQHKKTSSSKVVQTKTTQSVAKSSNENNQPVSDADRFDSLSQKEKIATLIKASYIDNAGVDDTTDLPFLHTHYTIFMGVRDKFTIDDDGEGVGDPLDHSTMFQDMKNGSYQDFSPESKAQVSVDMSKDNSYWKPYKTYTKADLWQNYSNNKNMIEQLVPQIDLSHSAEDFGILPMNQMTMPAGATAGPEEDGDSDNNNNDGN